MKINLVLGASIIALAICFIMVPVVAATAGGWYAYWGAILISIVWTFILLWLKLTRYWKGED
jgi:hypothetical protein